MFHRKNRKFRSSSSSDSYFNVKTLFVFFFALVCLVIVFQVSFTHQITSDSVANSRSHSSKRQIESENDPCIDSKKRDAKPAVVVVSINVIDAGSTFSKLIQDESVLTLSETNHRQYAERHGYSYVELKERNAYFGALAAHLPIQYQKVGLLRQLMQEHSEYEEGAGKWQSGGSLNVHSFLWIDGDALFMNCSVDVLNHVWQFAAEMYGKRKESALSPDTVHGTAIDGNSQLPDLSVSNAQLRESENDKERLEMVITGDLKNPVNNGVFGIRNSQWSRQFVEDWYQLSMVFGTHPKPWTGQGYHDQSVLIMMLNGLKPQHVASFVKGPMDATTLQSTEARDRNLQNNLKNMVKKYEKPVRRKKTINAIESKRNHGIFADKQRMKHVAIIPQNQMNSFAAIYKKADFAIHFAGSVQKSKDMKEFFAKSTCERRVEEDVLCDTNSPTATELHSTTYSGAE